VYGPAAASVEIELGSWYTDEYFIALPLDIIVYDGAAQALNPDLETAWWRAQQAAGYPAVPTHEQQVALIDKAEAKLTRDLPLPLVPSLMVPLQEPVLTFPRLYCLASADEAPSEGTFSSTQHPLPPAMVEEGIGRSDDPLRYHAVTDAELADLVAAYHDDNAWRSIVAFARDVYGSSAAVLAFSQPLSQSQGERHVERADESHLGLTVAAGPYYAPSIGELAPKVFNVDGQQLEPDLTTDWWRNTMIRAGKPHATGHGEATAWHRKQITEYFTALSWAYALENEVDYPEWLAEHAPDRRVRTDRPPTRGIETLYVLAAEHPIPRTGFRQYPLPAEPEDYDTFMARMGKEDLDEENC
jgi:hypothetical protein